MARRTKQQIQLDKAVDAAFRKHSVPINIFDIEKVMTAGQEAGKAGGDIDAAVAAAFAIYGQAVPA